MLREPIVFQSLHEDGTTCRECLRHRAYHEANGRCFFPPPRAFLRRDGL